MSNRHCDPEISVVSRRNFLKLSGATLFTITLPVYLQRAGLPANFQAQRVEYPQQVIGRLSELQVNDPVSFNYPWDHPAAANILIRLNEPAGGGVGPDNSVVAFNSFCTHQGGPLADQFHGDVGVAGPCLLHLTTFDLTRHGMVVSGHATQGLPQIILETEGDDIIASGVMGLIYSYHDNRVDPSA